MSIKRDVFRPTAKRVRTFTRDVKREPWKVAHEQAKACFLLEDVIETGLWVYSGISHAELFSRQSSFDGRLSPEEEESDRELLNQAREVWSSAAEILTRTVEQFSKQGWEVKGAQELCKRHMQCLAELQRLGPNAAIERIGRERIERGQRDIEAGRTIPLEEVIRDIRSGGDARGRGGSAATSP